MTVLTIIELVLAGTCAIVIVGFLIYLVVLANEFKH
jgi:hypothetical protein